MVNGYVDFLITTGYKFPVVKHVHFSGREKLKRVKA